MDPTNLLFYAPSSEEDGGVYRGPGSLKVPGLGFRVTL